MVRAGVATDPGPRDRAAIRARLDDLRARYERDAPHQHFVTDHTRIVFDDGDCAARLMFIGEAPGADEDRTGVPFVGRAGQLLNKMIAAMGMTRESVYIANVLKTRPPNNATPTTEEIRLCAPYLFEQVSIVRPEVIVTLGLPATRALLESSESMSRLRGRWYDFTPPGFLCDPIPVLPTYHPAFLLRSYTRENREKVWADLRMVMDRLGLTAVAGSVREPDGSTPSTV
ncbi:MAG: uracil-DNA glycosylase [Phycisphaerae bacterium]|nr:uracil-DNA glycosylase [Phycisphaerae bacterium]